MPCIAPGQHRNPCPVLEQPQEVVSVGSKACKEGKQTQLGPMLTWSNTGHCIIFINKCKFGTNNIETIII